MEMHTICTALVLDTANVWAYGNNQYSDNLQKRSLRLHPHTVNIVKHQILLSLGRRYFADPLFFGYHIHLSHTHTTTHSPSHTHTHSRCYVLQTVLLKSLIKTNVECPMQPSLIIWIWPTCYRSLLYIKAVAAGTSLHVCPTVCAVQYIKP